MLRNVHRNLRLIRDGENRGSMEVVNKQTLCFNVRRYHKAYQLGTGRTGQTGQTEAKTSTGLLIFQSRPFSCTALWPARLVSLSELRTV